MNRSGWPRSARLQKGFEKCGAGPFYCSKREFKNLFFNSALSDHCLGRYAVEKFDLPDFLKSPLLIKRHGKE